LAKKSSGLVVQLTRRREKLIGVLVEELPKWNKLILATTAVDGTDDVRGLSRRSLPAFEQAGVAGVECLVQCAEIVSIGLRYHA
jgi:hypothetical protein